MTPQLIKTFLEQAYKNAYVQRPSHDGDGQWYRDGDRLASDIQTLLKLMDVEEKK